MTPAPGGTVIAGSAPGDGVRVFLKDIQVAVACGLHPWEQHPQRPNRLLVSVEMWGDAPSPAAAPLGQGAIIDYDRVRDHVLAWSDRPHTPLLETLLEDLAAFIFEDARVSACRVVINKPDIFPETAGAGVELTRTRPGRG